MKQSLSLQSISGLRAKLSGRVIEPHDGRASYQGATWDRLAAVKARYDPTNFFRRKHNIPPRSA